MKVHVLIDDLDEAVVKAFGRMPNMTFVVDKQGLIAYKADWMEASRISEILDELLSEQETATVWFLDMEYATKGWSR